MTGAGKWIIERFAVDWESNTPKLLQFEALAELATKFPDFHRTLMGTWQMGANGLAVVILALMFARYPHRNAKDPTTTQPDGTEWSYYDTTFRGQTEVELWMMGEGPHHMHHAKNDVSYSYLTQVCDEVEGSRPDIVAATRTTPADLRDLEYKHEIPPTNAEVAAGKATTEYRPDPAPSPGNEFHVKRTQQVAAAVKTKYLAGDAAAGLEDITAAIVQSASSTCYHADRAFLRQVLKDMMPATADPACNPLPSNKWCETILSDETAEELFKAKALIESEARRLARAAAEKAFKDVPQPNDAISFGETMIDVVAGLAEVLVSESGVSAEALQDYWTALGKRTGRVASEEAARAKEGWLHIHRRLTRDPPEDRRELTLLELEERRAHERYSLLKKRDLAAGPTKDSGYVFHKDHVVRRLKRFMQRPLPSETKRNRGFESVGTKASALRTISDLLFASPSTAGSHGARARL
eukprot:INCI7626.3.p1 GENE.INCI7626.3~~INCI7626.3.p1  ORF type:complete len:468 (-),score=82.89 INCI7626.3:494-1897(-)